MMWHHVEMGKVANVVSGYGFPREYQGLTDEEFPFFKVGDMNLPGNEKCMTTIANTISGTTLKELKAKAFPKGTIIFPKIGAAIATNKKRMLTQPSVVDNNVMGLIPKPHIKSWYLYYWMLQFRSPEYQQYRSSAFHAEDRGGAGINSVASSFRATPYCRNTGPGGRAAQEARRGRCQSRPHSPRALLQDVRRSSHKSEGLA